MPHVTPHTFPPLHATAGPPPTFDSFAFESFDELPHVAYLKPLPVAGSSRLARYLALRLPEVAARVGHDDPGVLRPEMGALTLAVRAAVSRGDCSAVHHFFGEVG